MTSSRAPARSSSWSTWPAGPSPTPFASERCGARRRCAGSARRPRRSTTRTSAGSSTATSSPPTSCSTAAASCTSPTSGSPGWSREDTITSTGELFGTAAYLSPEQALGREATGASDRYALAVVAFELLTGERPFEAQHFAAQARQHIEDERPRASDRDRTLPPAVDDVLVRGMAKEPDERFETAGAFVDALETVLSGGVAVTTQRLTAQRRRTHAPEAFLGVPAMGRWRRQRRRRQRAAPARGATARGTSCPPAPARRSAQDDGLVDGGELHPARLGPPPAAGRVVALIALLVAIGGVGDAGAGRARRSLPPCREDRGAQLPRTPPPAARAPPPPPSPRPSTGTSTASATTPPRPPPPPPPTAEQLQLSGHDEMMAGQLPGGDRHPAQGGVGGRSRVASPTPTASTTSAWRC